MMKKLLFMLLLLSGYCVSHAQSFEVMPGTERLFVDAQYLKFFDANNRLSLFTRARATTAITKYSHQQQQE